MDLEAGTSGFDAASLPPVQAGYSGAFIFFSAKCAHQYLSMQFS